jgi:hypothetical protein
MKTLTALTESLASGMGVANHYTPIENIIVNVRNLFASYFGLVVEPGEDGVSIKIHNSEFTDPDKVYKILYTLVDRYNSVASYIKAQGLDVIKLVNIGRFYVVYFCPSDIASAENPNDECEEKCAPCTEMLQYNIDEAELSSIGEAVNWNGDEEMEDKTKEEVANIINMDDKIKAATAFADKMSHVIELPENFYIKAVKDSDGNESIALRYKYNKRRPFDKTVLVTKSLINIYNTEKNGIWVDAYENKDSLDENISNIIDQVLKWLGVKETSDPCVWGWPIANGVEIGSKSDENEENNNAGDNVTANGNNDTNIV